MSTISHHFRLGVVSGIGAYKNIYSVLAYMWEQTSHGVRCASFGARLFTPSGGLLQC